MARSWRKKRGRGDDIEETLASIPTTKQGCDIAGGNWNEKSKQCDLRQERDKDRPDEIVVKKFDKVIRADQIKTTLQPDEE